jgi:hypothetical protein
MRTSTSVLAASLRASGGAETAEAAAEEAGEAEGAGAGAEAEEAASAAAQRARALRRECLTSAKPALDRITETASAEAPPPPPPAGEPPPPPPPLLPPPPPEGRCGRAAAASARSSASRQEPNSPASNLPVTADLLASSAAVTAEAWAAGKFPESARRERSLRAWSAKRQRSQPR